MNPAFHALRSRLSIAALVLISAIPVAAAPKRRAIQPLTEVTVKGVAVDLASGKPVISADVTNGDRATVTDASGAFEIKVPAGRPTSIIVRRSGYETGTVTLVPAGSPNITVQLKSTPSVQLRLTNGTTYQLDYETAQFAYLVPFSGYATSNQGNFCTPDGKEFHPDKSTIGKVTGPAADATSSACCSRGPVKAVNVQLKNGNTTQAFFVDSCFQFEVDFLGRDHTTGQFVYLKFTDIAEIVFP